MELQALLARDGNDRAVSPVIGVILMVAITVILAAIIGTFVLGLGNQVENNPTASFNAEYETGTSTDYCSVGTDGQVTITHSTGQDLEAANLNVTDADGNRVPWDENSDGTCAVTSGDVAAGASMTVNVDSDDTIRVIWSETDSSATLMEYNAPDA